MKKRPKSRFVNIHLLPETVANLQSLSKALGMTLSSTVDYVMAKAGGPRNSFEADIMGKISDLEQAILLTFERIDQRGKKSGHHSLIRRAFYE